jgi:putative sterol carrier protein
MATYGTDEWEAAYQEILQRRLEEHSPPYIMGTPEWTDAYENLVKSDQEYREAAKEWEGTVALCTLMDPELGMEEDSYLLMDLWHGECRRIRLVPVDVGQAADFVITGQYSVWKKVNRAELDATKAMMQGRLKLRGDLPTLVRSNRASTRLTEITSSMQTVFPDDLPLEQIEELTVLGREMKEKLS